MLLYKRIDIVHKDPHLFFTYGLFDCLDPHEQFFSYLAAVTITGDSAMLSTYDFQQ
jgi:hypothetical protein